MLNRRDFMAAGASLLAVEVFGSAGESALEASKRWFRQAQYGMMVHWGLYSLVGGEWKGKRMDNRYIGEWAQQYFRIPNAEYDSLAKAFNPIFFNADEGAVERPLRSRPHPAAGLSHQFADRMRNLRLHVRERTSAVLGDSEGCRDSQWNSSQSLPANIGTLIRSYKGYEENQLCSRRCCVGRVPGVGGA